MSLPKLAPTPRAALHSPRSHAGIRGRRAWLRDTTVWLALGLSLATTMVVLFRTTAGTPKTTAYPTTTRNERGASGVSRSPTTPSTLVPRHLAAAIPKRPVAATTKRSTTTTVQIRNAPTAATTLPASGQVTAATKTPPPLRAIAVVTEEWAGTLTYPDDVATSYSFTTTGGAVVVRTGLLRGAAGLSASLQCSNSPVISTSHTDEITMKAPAGPCTYNLQFVETAFESGARAGYRITASYPAVVPAS
jgi:hypothetical protein